MVSLDVKQIESVAQIYSRIIIEQTSETQQKVDIDFIFSELRVVVSLPTFERLFKFS